LIGFDWIRAATVIGSSFLGLELGRRVGLDGQGVDGSILEFFGKDLVDQPVALEEWHLFKGGGNDRHGDLGPAIAAASLDDGVKVGDRRELGVLRETAGADKVVCDGGCHGCFLACERASDLDMDRCTGEWEFV